MKRRAPLAFAITSLFLVSLFSLLPSCSEDPTTVQEDEPILTGRGGVDPGGDTDFLLGSVTLDPATGARIDVWGHNLAIESDSVVSFELVLKNKSSATVNPPLHFIITEVIPYPGVVAINCDFNGPALDWCGFDLSDDLGPDGVLGPGEETSPVVVRFQWTEPMSFALGFMIEVGAPVDRGSISGTVFNDINRNGRRDSAEPGLPGVTVVLDGGGGDSSVVSILTRTRTNDRGHYRFGKLGAGVYKIAAVMPLEAIPTTPNPLLVTLVQLPDGTIPSFEEAHFGFFIEEPPPPPIPDFIFGPAPVGPASPLGTYVDSTFFNPRPKDDPPDYRYFVRIEPPMLAGPWPIHVDSAHVWIDDELVFSWYCERDTLPDPNQYQCWAPVARVMLEPPGLSFTEHSIAARVNGNEHAVLFISVERELPHR
jgi:hypothetical protein